MKMHLTQDQLIDYILHTLTDAEREHIEAELLQCTDCRTHLLSLQSEYRTLEQNLRANMRQLSPSPQANFAALAPQLTRPNPFDSWSQLRPVLTTLALLTALILLAAVVISNQEPIQSLFISQPQANESQPLDDVAGDVVVLEPRRPLPDPVRNGSFEETREERPSFWTRTGSQAHAYQVQSDNNEAVSGKASLMLTSTEDEIDGFGLIKQWFPAGDFAGQRVRLSAHIKTENVSEQVGLWTHVSAPGLSQDLMQPALIRGTSDWQPVEIVWDVPKEATTIELGLVLFGAGHVWMDDVVLETVNQETAVSYIENRLWWSSDYGGGTIFRKAFTNLDFEDEFVHNDAGWKLSNVIHYGIKQDTTQVINGEASALLQSTTANEQDTVGWFSQSIRASAYRELRVRLSAQVKTENVMDQASLFIRIDDSSNQTLVFGSQPVSGTTDWTKLEIVLQVPQDSALITIGTILNGSGNVWLDDLTFEIVDGSVPVTAGIMYKFDDLRNSDFEDPFQSHTYLSGWFLAGSKPENYLLTQDNAHFVSGTVSGHLASMTEDTDGFGTLMQSFKPDNYLNQRIRLTAKIKTEGVQDWAGMWLRIDGANGKQLQFDNMQPRPIQGSTDWTTYEIVLDVPSQATGISLGVLLSSTGQVWMDDVQLEIVGKDVPTTN